MANKSSKSLTLRGFCDADWGNSKDCHCITGYGFQLLPNSSMISWEMRKQTTVSLSICEVEYMPLQEAKFLIQLLNIMINSNENDQVTICCENHGTIALAKNTIDHQCSKHVGIKYHFMRTET